MMKTTIALVASLLALLLAGCGEESSEPDAGPADSSQSDTAPTEETESTPPSEEKAATKVEYSRSGGIAGVEMQYAFVAGEEPPAGFTADEQEAVLAAASAPALQALPESGLPKDLCCDLFLYEVTVTWGDGTTRTYSTADGRKQPAPLAELLQAAG